MKLSILNRGAFGAALALTVGCSSLFAQKIDQRADIEKHIKVLASDEFEGRFPATLGDTLSTNYILDELKSYEGVTLWGNDGRQRFSFALKESHSTAKTSRVACGNTLLEWNKDYYPAAYSASAGASAPVAFAGYGIYAFGEKSRDDFANVDLNGKWALILRETPEDRLAFTSHCTDYAKVQEAAKRGAVGVILVHGVRDRWQLLETTELWQPQCDVPVVCVTRPAANKMLEGSGKSIEELESEWSKEPQRRSVESTTIVSAQFGINRVMTPTNNIIAMVEGSDPELKKEIILISAHYDHYGNVVYKGRLGEKSFEPQVYNGANDNASGSAALLAMAKRYGQLKGKLKRTIVFAFVGAEERGLVGSKYLAQHIDDLAPYGTPRLAINVDMIGSAPAAGNSVLLFGVETFKEGANVVAKCKKRSKINIKTANGMGITSDHIPFSQHAALPILGFHTTDPERIHSPFDDIEYIDFEGMDKIVDCINRVADEVVLKATPITFESEVY